MNLFDYAIHEVEHVCKNCVHSRPHEQGRAVWCKLRSYPCCKMNSCASWKRKETAATTCSQCKFYDGRLCTEKTGHNSPSYVGMFVKPTSQACERFEERKRK